MAEDQKPFKIAAEDICELIPGRRAGIASDRITVDGRGVGFMYREESMETYDSGWQFMAGDEDQSYADNAENFSFYTLNTIANYDPAIIPYLDSDVGSAYERIAGTDLFRSIVESSPTLK